MKEFFSLKLNRSPIVRAVAISLLHFLVFLIFSSFLLIYLNEQTINAELNYQETVAIIQSGNLRAAQSYKQGYRDGYFTEMVNCALQSCESRWIIDMNGYRPVK